MYVIDMNDNRTVKDLAYIAGVLDSEGCIVIKAYKPEDGRYTYQLYVNVVNTNLELIEHIKSILGGRIYCPRKPYGNSNRLLYYIVWTASRAVEVLNVLLPYLIVKKNIAELGVDFQCLVEEKDCKTRALTEAEHILRQEFVTQSAMLNANGGQYAEL